MRSEEIFLAISLEISFPLAIVWRFNRILYIFHLYNAHSVQCPITNSQRGSHALIVAASCYLCF